MENNIGVTLKSSLHSTNINSKIQYKYWTILIKTFYSIDYCLKFNRFQNGQEIHESENLWFTITCIIRHNLWSKDHNHIIFVACERETNKD